MGVRVKSLTNPLSGGVLTQTEVVDSTIEQREATVDGYTFHFGPNETKNFLDEGVGAAVAAFGDDGIVEDIVPFDNPRF